MNLKTLLLLKFAIVAFAGIAFVIVMPKVQSFSMWALFIGALAALILFAFNIEKIIAIMSGNLKKKKGIPH